MKECFYVVNKCTHLVGQACKEHRRKIGKTQISVSVDTGYSIENICGFENGRTNNMYIFLWYVKHGLDVKEILNKVEGFKDET